MMLRLTLALLVLIGLPVRADDPAPLVVNVGGTGIKISCPAGMIDVPKDDTEANAVADLIPDNCQLLRSFITADAEDRSKPLDPAEDIMITQVVVMKDALFDIDSGNFIDIVAQIARKSSHGVLKSQDSAFDFVESQKRLDQFQKDTGLGVEETSDVYSLGMVSRSSACVAFMAAQYVNMTSDGKTKRKRCASVIGYVRLKQKVIVVITSVTRPYLIQDDLRTLKHTAERYHVDLQNLNNS